ncbi:hypothetical protein B1R94_12920 [Mycolicibacterium litorale]|nr:hypothetical protein B1R94_12920 [Mycolicibacterium litorale]
MYQDLGGAHPATWYKTFAYDETNAASITFDTLFRPGTQPLNDILPVVERQTRCRYLEARSPDRCARESERAPKRPRSATEAGIA